VPSYRSRQRRPEPFKKNQKILQNDIREAPSSIFGRPQSDKVVYMDGETPNFGPRENTGPPQDLAAITLLLNQAQAGVDGASDRLLELVYEQLRATAGSYFRNQAANHTLQPTALVHEAYLKLIGNPEKQWDGRAHFCAVASTAMRHILRDHARSKRAAKRGGDDSQRTPLTQIEAPSGSSAAIDPVTLDETLATLQEIDELGARIVELRYFGGLTNEEIAGVLDTSLSTVERRWRTSKAWLKTKLDNDDGSSRADL